MTTKRELLISTSICLLSAQTAIQVTNSSFAITPKKGEKSINCFGINTCKGTNGCNIGKMDIDLANKVFNNQFTKTAVIECAGNSDCSAKNGFLAWIAKANNKACFDAGGFVIEKNEQNKFIIRDKNGIKS